MLYYHINKKGSNSASGSVRACHEAAPGSVPVVRGEASGNLVQTCRLSTLETVYLSRLA